jgi:hypothetical protein
MTDESLQEEIRKLGGNGRERVLAVEQYLRSHGAGAEDIIANLKTAAAIENFEKIIAANRTSQRAAEPPKPAPAAAPAQTQGEPSKVDDATWAKMSHSEKWAYARQWDQSKHLATGVR